MIFEDQNKGRVRTACDRAPYGIYKLRRREQYRQGAKAVLSCVAWRGIGCGVQ